MATETKTKVDDHTRAQLVELMGTCTLPVNGEPEIVTTIDGQTWSINSEEAWTYGDRSTIVTADGTDSGF